MSSNQAGWGAALQSIGGSIMGIDELYRERKRQELAQQERARAEKLREDENRRQNEELKMRQAEAQRQVEQQRQMIERQLRTDTLAERSQVPYDQPLSPEMVAREQQAGTAGSLRTVAPKDAALPSRRWQGEMNNPEAGGTFEYKDPGQQAGMFRNPNLQERMLEDTQAERAQAAQTANSYRMAEGARTRQATAEQKEADRQARLESDKYKAEQSGMLRSISMGIAQQNADTNRGRLEETQKQNQIKRETAEEKLATTKAAALAAAQDIYDKAEALKTHPGFKNLFGPVAGRVAFDIMPETMDARVRLNQVVAQKALDALMEMRRTSPTGGALGNVSDADIKLLKDASTRLSTKQSVDSALKGVDDLQAAAKRVMDAIQKTGGGATPVNPANLKPGDPFMGGTFLGWK
jgi:hypothetical protein